MALGNVEMITQEKKNKEREREKETKNNIEHVLLIF